MAGKIKTGKPRKRWNDEFENDLNKIRIRNWRTVARAWREQRQI